MWPRSALQRSGWDQESKKLRQAGRVGKTATLWHAEHLTLTHKNGGARERLRGTRNILRTWQSRNACRRTSEVRQRVCCSLNPDDVGFDVDEFTGIAKLPYGA